MGKLDLAKPKTEGGAMHSIALILRRVTQSFALLPPQSLRDSSPNNAKAFWGSIWKEEFERLEQLEQIEL